VKRDELLFEVLLGIIIIIFITTSFYYSPKARLVPLVVGFISLGLVIIQVITDAMTGKSGQKGEEAKFFQSKFIYAVLFSIAYGSALFLLGYYGSLGIFSIVATRYWFKEKWGTSFIITGALLLFSYVLFVVVFGIELYPGIIPAFISSFLIEE